MGDNLIRQHLIDPEICIRCNTCEATCPVGAITHDDRNYVVDVAKCGQCMDCVAPCPTGSIDNWREVSAGSAYSVSDQLGWDELPPADSAPASSASVADAGIAVSVGAALRAVKVVATPTTSASPRLNATLPPWSAAHPYTNLVGPRCEQVSLTARVSGNVRVTQMGSGYDTHHLVLDLGDQPFPLLEGQSIGVLPPGVDANGRPHVVRQYSIASPRNGERAGYNNFSLTVKRVLQDRQGQAVRGVASNYLCDLAVGDAVQIVGPYGTSFLMPNHPGSHIVMICTGTGSAPMRAITEWRRRMAQGGKFVGGRLHLFFGARSPEDLPYFGPLQRLPQDFIDIHFAYSRVPGQPKRYVQDVLREQAARIGPLLADPNAYFYVCGIRSMEEGVNAALRDLAIDGGMDWNDIAAQLRQRGRLHVETY